MFQALAADLRKAAEEIEARAYPTFVRQGINLVEAGEAIAAVCKTTCITAHYWASCTEGARPRLVFEVWDGKRHFESNSLADAVNMCLAAHHAEQAKNDAGKDHVNGILEAVGAAPDPFDGLPL